MNRISLGHGLPPWLGLEPVGGTSSHRLANYGVTKTFWCYQNMARPSTEKVTPRKPGRPATGRDPVLTVRLPLTVRSAIEMWAKQQKDRPSRSEAIRRSRLAGARCYALLLLEPLVVGLGPNVYNIMHRYTRHGMWPMRTNIEIDDVLMRQAQKASGHATKKQTVEEALRLMIRMRRQHQVDAAFGRYRWRGNLARSRTGRGAR